MGIPYSRQINDAFDQVTPLVAEGFQVLETTKNIAIILAWIQVLTVGLLALILTSLVALLITMNPDLAAERKAIVTPTLKIVVREGAFFIWATGGILLFTAMVGGIYFAIHGGSVNGDAVGDEAKKEAEEGKRKDGEASEKPK